MKNDAFKHRTGFTPMQLFIMYFGIGFLFFSTGSFAADEIGGGVCSIVNILTGKWLFGFTMLAILGGGAAILFGAEISDGIKKLATIVTVVGLILGSSQLLSLAFSKFGSVAC